MVASIIILPLLMLVLLLSLSRFCNSCKPGGYKNKVTIGEKTFLCVYVAPINWTTSGEYMMIPIEAKADSLTKIRIPQSWTSQVYNNDTLMQRIGVTKMRGYGVGAGVSLASMGVLSYQRIYREVVRTYDPTRAPTQQPVISPTASPVFLPTIVPTREPSIAPSMDPTMAPSCRPTLPPTCSPTAPPTFAPTLAPTSSPTVSVRRRLQGSDSPTSVPTSLPLTPTKDPSHVPSMDPTHLPTTDPTYFPTADPTQIPTENPSLIPTEEPTYVPTENPTTVPTADPTFTPSHNPTSQPSAVPSSRPSLQPSVRPTSRPSSQPNSRPSSTPNCAPTSQPSTQPSSYPSTSPSLQPISAPTSQPSCRPSRRPSSQPSSQPSSHPTVFNTTGLPKTYFTPITFPILFAIVYVDHGKVKTVAWDNFCSWCDAATCRGNSVDYDESVIGQEGGNCFVLDEECYVDVKKNDKVVGKSVNALCELNIYVSWYGTDSSGTNFQSSASRFSRWSDSQMRNFTSVLMDEAVLP